MEEGQKKHKGGAVKRAPEGQYLASEAMKRLGINHPAFWSYVNKGRIERHVPPGRRDGYYDKEEVAMLATELNTFDLEVVNKSKRPLTTSFAQATIYDIPGLTDVLRSYDWPFTPVAQRETWYKVNSRIDYIVRYKSLILGYVNIMPLQPTILEEMMAGRMRGWHIKSWHLLPFEPGKEYDCFAGIAVRKVKHGRFYAAQLIDRFVDTLSEMAAHEHIFIRHLYATSDQKDGEGLSRDLGFVRQPRVEGDLFNRFVLDMEMATSSPVQRYREIVQQAKGV